MKYSDIKECVRVVISDHAHEQWNERVGPYIKDIRQLEEIFTNYLRELDRLSLTRHDCLVFDEEIVGGVAIASKNRLVVESFFGRISLNPILADHDLLTRFMKKQIDNHGKRNSKLVRNIKSEGINLNLSKNVLNMQRLPKFPKMVKTIKIMSNCFKLSYWRSDSIEVKQVSGNVGVGQTFFMDVNQPHLVYGRVEPNSLSHIHIAKLCVAIANLQDSVDREKVSMVE